MRFNLVFLLGGAADQTFYSEMLKTKREVSLNNNIITMYHL